MSAVASKTKVRHLSAVGIIYLVSNPSLVLVNMTKARTTPRAFQWTLDLLGGEWSGPLAKADGGPLDTFRRSAEQDLGITFKRGEPLLLGKDDGGFTREESTRFLNFRKEVSVKAVPWRDYLVSVDASVIRSVPGGHESPYQAVISYHLVGVEETQWLHLQQTLDRFENVSRSGLSHTATYRDIIARGQAFGFGHETAMVDFWSEHGHTEARHLKRLLREPAQNLGKPMSSYKDYSAQFDFAVSP